MWTQDDASDARALLGRVIEASRAVPSKLACRTDERLGDELDALREAVKAATKAQDRAALEAHGTTLAPFLEVVQERLGLSQEAREEEWRHDLARVASVVELVRTAPAEEAMVLAREGFDLLGWPSTLASTSILGEEREEAKAALLEVLKDRAGERDVRRALQAELVHQAVPKAQVPARALEASLDAEVLARVRLVGWAYRPLEVAPDVVRIPWALTLAGTVREGGVGDITGLPGAVVETAVALLRSNPGAVIEDVLTAARGLEE